MIEIVEHFGIRLHVDPEFMSPKLVKALKAGYYEAPEARNIGKIIQPNEVILEIGAGIGFMTALMLKNPDVERVVSFEANPLLIPKIQRTLSENGLGGQRFELHNAILSNTFPDKNVEFHVHKDFWASSLVRTSDTIRSHSLPVTGFDETIKAVRPSLIVCDIEGGEEDLFSKATLSGVRDVYIELHQRVIGGKGIRNTFQKFHDYGFHYNQNYSSGSIILFSRVEN